MPISACLDRPRYPLPICKGKQKWEQLLVIRRTTRGVADAVPLSDFVLSQSQPQSLLAQLPPQSSFVGGELPAPAGLYRTAMMMALVVAMMMIMYVRTLPHVVDLYDHVMTEHYCLVTVHVRTYDSGLSQLSDWTRAHMPAYFSPCIRYVCLYSRTYTNSECRKR